MGEHDELVPKVLSNTITVVEKKQAEIEELLGATSETARLILLLEVLKDQLRGANVLWNNVLHHTNQTKG